MQGSLLDQDELLGEALSDLTFVVVDLETTGGSPADSAITEIGAVKVRGGEILGEFQTLVNPGRPIPPFITVLTGIGDAMVAPAPRVEQALPAFLEFAAGSVLVAHNAPFDLGFLRSACADLGYPWPRFRKVDTAVLARRVLTRDEAPNCKLSTLARLFSATTQPCHRALDDARATVDVLHGLIARIGNLGVHTLPELIAFTRQVSEAQRRKRHLAEHLPDGPGVYVFRDREDRPLYVGTSRHLRSRVRQYFVSSEQRSRMADMIAAAERVEAVECAHALEAEVRELRIIAAHKPPYNRRSKFPERTWWVVLTDEPYPRLSVVRQPRDGCLGPFTSRRQVESAVAAIHEALPLRQCSKRLSTRRLSTACVLLELGRCGAPCLHQESVSEYSVHVENFHDSIRGDPSVIAHPLLARIRALSEQARYEDAAAARDRLAAFLRALSRTQRFASLSTIDELVAANRDTHGGWEISVLRRGRLVAAGVSPPMANPWPTVHALVATAETVRPGPGPTPCASSEEMDRILRWLHDPGTRLVRMSGGWHSPAAGAQRWRPLLDRIAKASSAADPLADPRQLRTLDRPTRAFS